VGDHVQKILKPNFAASWDEIGDENEVEDTYHLSEIESLEEAVKQIIQFLGKSSKKYYLANFLKPR
jgi:coatomer protein complex subunit gamma